MRPREELLSAHDQADGLAVAFQLPHATTSEWRIKTNSASAAFLVGSGEWSLVDVPLATNANRRRGVQVTILHNASGGDVAYTANPRQIAAPERTGWPRARTVFDMDTRVEVGENWLPLKRVGELVKPCRDNDLKFLLICGIVHGLRFDEIVTSRRSWFQRLRFHRDTCTLAMHGIGSGQARLTGKPGKFGYTVDQTYSAVNSKREQ